MKLSVLRNELDKRKAQGLDWIQLTTRLSRSPKNWDRVRLWRGLYARCIGEVRRHVYLFDVPIKELEQAMVKESDVSK